MMAIAAQKRRYGYRHKRRFHKDCWARRRVFQQIRQQPSLRNAS
ncbi:hypothetical protein BURMUCGD2M_6349 [Burkholderia multivorans CGD2M]|uniref:Uncharacterized protein n=1 Tax=Burkholderia multivorans CGD2 TaxID=513052 RepID=B9BNU0_9BURK|nr:hypothetical protein BURMUCGD2_6360 [Burkholderia multivorans CGD2]EEE13628.1 hypothetical protein BURMUCGD2M_6349 [Burkholderia multivorans CGD2M]